MNILINFRYISTIDQSEGSASEVFKSDEINSLTRDFKRIALEYKNLNIKTTEFMTNNKIYSDTINIITKTVSDHINGFNNSDDHYCYIWLDEICSIIIDGIRAYPLENPHEYVNYEDIKHTVQRCIFEITKRDESIKPDNYSNVFFVVYLDIIEKGLPSFYIIPEW